nr:hypothetical protein [Tanacetum cinerariifolium]
MFSQFDSGGANGSGGCRTRRRVPTIRTTRMRMAMAMLSCVMYGIVAGKFSDMFSQFESGGASGSGGCGDEKEGADHHDDEDEDGDGDA